MDQSNHYRSLSEGLYNMFTSQILTDVILETYGVQIECHRNVLAATSPYFRAMFTNPVKERDERIVELQEVEPEILKSVIVYIYNGRIELTNEIVQDILVTASMFELEHLIELCSVYMVQEICLTNCVDMYMFASHYACLQLKDSAKNYILDHFTEIITDSDDISKLSFEDLQDIISSDDLWVDKEELVYDTIIKWISNEERIQVFPDLFRHVRLGLLGEQTLNKRVRTNPLISENRYCGRLLRQFDTYRSSMDNTPCSDDATDKVAVNGFCRPRNGMFNRTMLVFSSGGKTQQDRSLTTIDINTMKNYVGVRPHDTFDFKFKIDFFRLVSVSGNNVYFIGGIFYNDHNFEDYSTALKDVYQYNVKEIKWDKKASMNIGRCCFSTAVFGNAIYVLGGKPTYPRGEPTDSVEFYDTDLDVWAETSPLPIKMYHHASAATHDAIFVFGGKDEDDDILDTVFRYQISNESWSLVTTQMPKTRFMLSAFYFRSNLYLVGGESLHENIVTVNIYNPVRNKWSFGKDFPEERRIRHAAMHNGMLYICGGVRYLGISGRRSRKVESRDLYKYDIANETWTKEAKLVQYGNTESFAVAVLNTRYLQESEFNGGISVLKELVAETRKQQPLLTEGNEIAMSHEALKIKEAISNDWGAYLSRHKKEYWLQLKNHNQSLVYEAWRNSTPIILPQKLQMIERKDEPEEQRRRRERQVLDNFRSEKELLELKAQSHADHVKHIDEDLITLLEQKASGGRLSALKKMWDSAVKQEEEISVLPFYM